MVGNTKQQSVKSETSQDTRTIVTVLLLIFIFPIGIIVMWFWSRWKFWVKLLTTLILLIPLLFVILLIAGVGIGIFGMFASLNSGEQLLRSKDVARLNDMEILQKAIDSSLSKNPNQALCGKEQPVCFYTSDDNSPNARKSDGGGWFPLKLDSLNQLPIDPKNGKDYYYFYCSDGKDWEVNAFLESEKLATKMADDGGDEPEVYEIGTNLKLCQYSD